VQDIFLGAKRPPRPGRLLRKLAVLGLVVALALVVAYVVFARATGASAPSGTAPPGPLTVDGDRLALGGSSLERAGDVWVLRVTGDPYAMGYAAARLAGRALGDGGAALDPALAGEEPPGGLSGLFHGLRLRWRYRRLADGVPAPRRAELAGLAAGWRAAGIARPPTYQQLLWREAALDVGHVPGSLAPIGGLGTGLAFAVGGGAPGGPAGLRSAGGEAERSPLIGSHAVVGRTFGLTVGPAPAPLVVTFAHPDGERLAFARVGWAGDVGVVTGINSEGVAVCVDAAITEDVRPDAAAPPVAEVARDVLERAHDLDEAVAVLQAAHPLGSASFLVVDGKAGTWAVVERTPTKVAVARPKKAAVIGDVLAAAELARDADNDRARRARAGGARQGRLEELVGRALVADAPAVAALLRDRRGRGDVRLPAGNGNAVDDLAQAHVAVIDATALTLWVGEGPGAAGPLRAFDLRHELRGEPTRAGAQGVIAADPVADLAAARTIVLAQATLAAAARSARLGRWDAAAEEVARALALAPELAEAHRLAGDVAREQGDATAATEHYRRYLDLGPADPGAAGEVRAYLGGP
jgi:tetratricopeptide (TPR) repeat protein